MSTPILLEQYRPESLYQRLPAENITLREIQTDPPSDHLKVGEPVTRTIEIRAKGLTAEQLPQLMPSQPNTQGFKQYPDKPELITQVDEHGVTGIRREKIAMIPTQAGDLTLPGIHLDWWNSRTQKIQHADILNRVISVEGSVTAKPVTSKPIQPTASPTVAKKSEPQTINQTATPLQLQDSSIKIWQGISAFLAMGWLLTLLFLWYTRRPLDTTAVQMPHEQHNIQSLQRKIERACKKNNAEAASTLLLSWGAQILQKERIHHLGELRGISAELDQALAHLETYRYAAKHENTWDGNILSQAIKTVPQTKKREQMGSALEVL